jgi:hypothetical protein
MPVKDNQPQLLADLRLWFETPPPVRGLDFRSARQTNKGHGRLETRTLVASTELNDYLDWPGVQQVLRLERQVVHLKTGERSEEVRYAVTSLSPQLASAHDLLTLWRDHWAIENHLHWVRDVLFGEDASRVRTRHGPQVLAVCRNTVLTLLRLYGYPQIVQAREHFAARPSHAFGLVTLPVDSRLK